MFSVVHPKDRDTRFFSVEVILLMTYALFISGVLISFMQRSFYVYQWSLFYFPLFPRK